MSAAVTAEPQPGPLSHGVANAVAPPPGHPRFPLLDGMRGLAAVGVLVFHQGQIGGVNRTAFYGVITARLALAVPVFFVLSAFLLYRPFLAAWQGQAKPVRLRDYGRRRALRLLPGYWVALTVTAASVGLVGVFSAHWWVYYGFLQVYSRTWILNGISPAWSLCTEVAFYLALPAYVWTRTRRPPRPGWWRWELLALGAIATVSVAVRGLLKAQGTHVVLSWTLAGTADWFAVGLALAVLSVAASGGAYPRLARWITAHAALCWLVAALIFVLACAMGLPRSPQASGVPGQYTLFQFVAEHVLYGAIAGLIVLPCVLATPRSGLLSSVLANRVVRFLGTISFGVFLYHVPAMTWLISHHFLHWLPIPASGTDLLETLTAAIACATVSYYAVERPFLALKYRRARSARVVHVGAT